MGGGSIIIINNDAKFTAAFNFIVMNPLIEGGAKVVTVDGDPGGTTKYGVAQKFHPGVDVANLTQEEAEQIHHNEYWLAAGCDHLPWDMALCVYDCAVNQGVSVAVELLHHFQTSIGYMAARAVKYGEKGPTFEKFKEGWEIRLFRVFHQALQGP
jgi:lysozyme family protein